MARRSRFELVLASGSARRRELLEHLGLRPAILASEVDERRLSGEPPRAYVRRLAREKAAAVAARHPGAVVLAADTAVVVDARIMGKPVDPADARRMLRALGGRAHQVFTGVAVMRGERTLCRVVKTRVWLKALSAVELRWYLATGEPFDKAGAYAIQGHAGAFVERIAGSYSNVVGLPLRETLALLAEIGYPLPWGAR